MNTVIIKNLNINSLTDEEIRYLKEAGVDVVVTNNHGRNEKNSVIFLVEHKWIPSKKCWSYDLNPKPYNRISDVLFDLLWAEGTPSDEIERVSLLMKTLVSDSFIYNVETRVALT